MIAVIRRCIGRRQQNALLSRKGATRLGRIDRELVAAMVVPVGLGWWFVHGGRLWLRGRGGSETFFVVILQPNDGHVGVVASLNNNMILNARQQRTWQAGILKNRNRR